MEEQSTDVLDLRDYVAVLRRRKWTVAATTLLVVLVAVAVTLTQTPLYSSDVGLVVEPIGSQSDDSVLRSLVLGTQELQTQRELASSTLVAARAAEFLGEEDPSVEDLEELLEQVEVSLVRDTQILNITATSEAPSEAAAVAQAFGEGYLEYRRQQALDQLLQSTRALQQREEETRRRLDEIELQLRGTEGDRASLEVELQGLRSELAGLAAQQTALRGSEVFAQGGGQIIRPAQVPEWPVSPKPLRTGVLALVLGLMLGVGLAFLRDFLDDAIRSDEQASRATGHPVLGHIPRWAGAGEGDTRLVTIVEPSSPVAEAYRTLRTNVRFSTVSSGGRSILVTSPLAGEGKTTTAANLAVALARASTRVLLVGTDLRKPTIHRSFVIEQSPGLSDVLSGEAEIAEAIHDVGVPNLRVIPSGPLPPNPAELLGSVAMAQIMKSLESIADYVVYDGPPVMPVADALELGPRTSVCLMVIDTGVTGRHALRRATERLEAVGANMAGIVLNRIDPGDSYYGYAYYAQYIQTDDGSGSPRRRREHGRQAPAPQPATATAGSPWPERPTLDDPGARHGQGGEPTPPSEAPPAWGEGTPDEPSEDGPTEHEPVEERSEDGDGVEQHGH